MSKSQTKEYRCWRRIIGRCHNPDDQRWPWYGGRGIRVCERWRDDFDAFLADMGPAPTPAHTIEREKNHLGYHPENCRWATMKEQAQNRRSNVNITFEGRTQTMAQWAAELGIDRRVLWKRLKRPNVAGEVWSLDQALTEGRKLSINELAPMRNAA
jgi:hypothetical protein